MKYRIRQQERNILRRMARQMLILWGCAALAVCVIFLAGGREYTVHLSAEQLGFAEGQADGTALSFTTDGDAVSMANTSVTENGADLTFSPNHAGNVIVDVVRNQSEITANVALQVTPFGLIVDLNTRNFPHWRGYAWLLAVLIGCTCALMLRAFVITRRECLYSSLCIFYAGFSVWLAVAAGLQAYLACSNATVADMLAVIANSGFWFLVFCLPFCALFSAALCVSNLSLIRHEGVSRTNVLGFLLSAAMVAGFGLILWIYGLNLSASEQTVRVIGAACSTVTSVIALAECFLIGSIICGAMAARHRPAGEADYIIILGCAIRKDGTLYPLLRGRVDRALAFAREQEEKTGRQAVLVPSGGQGADEVISEAEAMKRYLLEQGVPETRILPEDRSASTAENMRFSRELIEKHGSSERVLFATTNYHVFRSGIIARQAGFAPEGIGSRTQWYYWPNAAVRELIGMVVSLRGMLWPLLLAVAAGFVALHLLMPM